MSFCMTPGALFVIMAPVLLFSVAVAILIEECSCLRKCGNRQNGREK